MSSAGGNLDLLDVLVRNARTRREDPVLVVDGRQISYGELVARLDGLVAGFRARGLAPGSRIGVAVYHDTLAAELYLAAQAAGLQPTLLSFGLARVMPELVARLGVQELVLGPQLDPAAFTAQAGAGGPRIWQVGAGAADVEQVRARMSAAPSAAGDWVRGRDDDVVSGIQFTAGSTGVPKAIVRTVGTDVWDAWHRGWAYGLGEGERWVCASPLNLSVLAAAMRASLLFSGAVVVMSEFSPEHLDAATADGVSVLPLQAPQWRAVLATGLAAELPGRGLRTAVVTGQLMAPRALRELVTTLAPTARVVMNYGTSEAGTLAVTRSTDPGFGTQFCVGRPVPMNALEVVGPDGRPVPVGEIGEVVVAGPAVAPGYLHELCADQAAPLLRAPRRTAPLRTGDAGRMDERGNLYLLGRWSDAVELAGRTVLPVAVEERLRAVPGVADAVFTVFEKPGGPECAGVLIEPEPAAPPSADPASSNPALSNPALSNPASVDTAALVDVLAEQVGVPVDIQQVDSLPRTAAGKPDRPAARRLLESRQT